MKIIAYFAATLLLISAVAVKGDEPAAVPPAGAITEQSVCKDIKALPWDQGLSETTKATWWITRSTIGEAVVVPEGGQPANFCSETRMYTGCSAKVVIELDQAAGCYSFRMAAFQADLNHVNYYETMAKKVDEKFCTFTSEVTAMNAQGKDDPSYAPVAPIPPNIIEDTFRLFSFIAVGEKKDWIICVSCTGSHSLWVLVKDELIQNQAAYETAKGKIQEAIVAAQIDETTLQDVATEIKDIKVDDFLNAPPSTATATTNSLTETSKKEEETTADKKPGGDDANSETSSTSPPP